MQTLVPEPERAERWALEQGFAQGVQNGMRKVAIEIAVDVLGRAEVDAALVNTRPSVQIEHLRALIRARMRGSLRAPPAERAAMVQDGGRQSNGGGRSNAADGVEPGAKRNA